MGWWISTRELGRAEALALRPRAEQNRAHAGRLPDAQRAYIWLDKLHRVIDCQARRHDPARRVDVVGALAAPALLDHHWNEASAARSCVAPFPDHSYHPRLRWSLRTRLAP